MFKNWGLNLRVCQLIYLCWQILILPQFLNFDEIGYYYLIQSFIALQMIGDLGVSQLVINLVAQKSQRYFNEFGYLAHIRNFQNLINITFKNSIALTLVFLVLATSYFYFLNEKILFDLKYLLFIMIFLLALDLLTSYHAALISGLTDIGNFYKYKFFRSATEYIVVIAFISLGFPFFALAFACCAGIIVAAIVVFLLFKNLKKSQQSGFKNIQFKYRDEFLPMQIKYLMTWLCGFLTFSTIVPLVFKFHGAAIAGKIGLLIALFGGLNIFIYTIVNYQSVLVSKLWINGEINNINKKLTHNIYLVIIVYAFIFCIVPILAQSTFLIKKIPILTDYKLILILCFIHAWHGLSTPYVIFGNSLLINDYYIKVLILAVVNLVGFIIINTTHTLGLNTSLIIFGFLQAPILYFIRNSFVSASRFKNCFIKK